MSKNLLSIQKTAKRLGVSTKTLRRWEASGKLIPHQRTVGNQRRYTVEQIEKVTSETRNPKPHLTWPKPRLTWRSDETNAKSLGFVSNFDIRDSSVPYSLTEHLFASIMMRVKRLTLPRWRFSLPKPRLTWPKPRLPWPQPRLTWPKLPLPPFSFPNLPQLPTSLFNRKHLISGFSEAFHALSPAKRGVLFSFLATLVVSASAVAGVRTGLFSGLHPSTIRGVASQHLGGDPEGIAMKQLNNGAINGKWQMANGTSSEVARVLGERITRENLVFTINVPTNLTDTLQVSGNATFSGELTAPNVLYGLTSGTGISLEGLQTPTITNTGVLSLGGKTGALVLEAGTDITIADLKISDKATLDTVRGRGGCTACVLDADVTDALTISSSGSVAAGALTADSLDFTQIIDSATLDASTAIAFGASTYSLTFTNNGTENFVVNLSSTGDFVLQDNGTTYATFSDTGIVTFTGNVGIGDTTPSSKLEVGDGTDSIQFSSVGDITFVDADGAASITGPAGGTLTIASGTNQNITFSPNGTGDLIFSTDADTVATFNGSADGTANVTLTAGDLTVSDGDLIVSGGDFNVVLDAGDGVNISKGAAPTVDVFTINGGTSTTDGVDNLQLTFTGSNASGNIVDITPSYSTNVADTFKVIDIDAFTATANDSVAGAGGNTATVLGVDIGNLTQSELNGEVVTSTTVRIGSGWDTDLAFVDTTPTVTIGDTGTLTITDGTNTLLTLADNSNTGDLTLTGDAAVNGGDVTTTATTATLFNTSATTLSLGGAATTALNLGNGSGNYTAINIGSGSVTHTINIAGTGATGTDTINIGTGGTGADTITVGNNASTTSLALTSGTGSQTFTSSVATGTTTSSAWVFTDSALTSGTGLYLTGSNTTGVAADIDANSLSSGYGLDVSSTSTAGTASSNSRLINLARSGANANLTHTAYGLYSSVTNTGTSSTNVGAYFTASGGTNNYAAIFDAGNVGIGTTSPSGKFHIVNGDQNIVTQASERDLAIYTNSGSDETVGIRILNNGATVGTGRIEFGDSGSGTMANIAYVHNDDSMRFRVNSAERVRITSVGNVKIAGTVARATTEGTNHLDIFDGTAPVGTLTNGISLYATTGELRVMDSGGTATLLSPHDDSGNWVFSSQNTVIGKDVQIQMERLMQRLDGFFGGGYFTATGLNYNENAIAKIDATGVLSTSLNNAPSSSAVCSSLGNNTDPTPGAAYELRDCDTAPATDYMEYYSVEAGVETGDIVVPTDSMVDRVLDGKKEAMLTKSSSPYQKSVIGIVSDPALATDFNSIGKDMIKTQDNPMPVALVGRVPVKVSTENGPIEVGDFLTSSSIPGVAMKATRPGEVIGKALEKYDGLSGETCPTQQKTTLSDGSLNNSGGLARFSTEATLRTTTSIAEDNQLVKSHNEGDLEGVEPSRPTFLGSAPEPSRPTPPPLCGKVMSFVNISFADPGSILANLVIDTDGLLKTQEPFDDRHLKLEVGSLQREGRGWSEASPSSSLQPQESSFQSPASTLKFKDLLSRLFSLEEKVASLAALFSSLHLRGVPPNTSEVLLDDSSEVNSILEASSSAVLAASAESLGLTNENARLDSARQATVSGTLTVLGRSLFSDVGITGTLSSGLLRIDGLGGAIDTFSGDLKLQGLALGGVDILAGKVTVDKEGNLMVTNTISAKTVEAEEIKVKGDKSIGSATIPMDKTLIDIVSPVASESSRIFLTPTAITKQQLVVSKKEQGRFRVSLPNPEPFPVSFDWWIVN